MRKSIISQDEYCRGCLCLPGCNVMLKEGEICGDKVMGLSDLSYAGVWFDGYEKEGAR